MAKKKTTILGIIERNLGCAGYLTVAEIAKKTGYSRSAVREAAHINGEWPMSTKHPWHLFDWRLATVDLWNVWGISYIQVAMHRMTNNRPAPKFDMRRDLTASADAKRKGYVKLQEAVKKSFDSNRAKWLKKEL